MMTSFFREKIVDPVRSVLSAGITPSALAAAVAYGIAGGLFPVPGASTLICLVPIVLLKLNPVIVQVINLILTPVNLALIPGFVSLGMHMINTISSDSGVNGVQAQGSGGNGGTDEALSVSALLGGLQTDFWGSLSVFRGLLFYAIVGWCAFAPVCVALVYPVAGVIFSYFLPLRTTSSSLSTQPNASLTATTSTTPTKKSKH